MFYNKINLFLVFVILINCFTFLGLATYENITAQNYDLNALASQIDTLSTNISNLPEIGTCQSVNACTSDLIDEGASLCDDEDCEDPQPGQGVGQSYDCRPECLIEAMSINPYNYQSHYNTKES
jgi:hypothetical protein